MRRGEIWWANLGPGGRRPVLLLSRDEAYLVRELVTVVPITTRIRNIPAEVTLGTEDGLPKLCVANTDIITTIAKASLHERLTALAPGKLEEVEAAIHFSLGLRKCEKAG